MRKSDWQITVLLLTDDDDDDTFSVKTVIVYNH